MEEVRGFFLVKIPASRVDLHTAGGGGNTHKFSEGVLLKNTVGAH